MERFGVEVGGEVSEVEEPVEDRLPAATPASRQETRPESTKQVDSVSAREEPLAQLRRLEAELERYREHAQRTSKLFLSVTKYVEWVRESARSEAELALSKARARVEKLDRASRKLEETELKLRQAQDDLAHLQVVTEETRARLSAFLAAGLQALDAGASAPVGIEDTLLERLASGSVSQPSHATPVENPLS